MEGIGTIGGIIGPAIAGWAYDNWGSYQIIWFLLAGLAVVAIISVSTITPVRNLMGPDDITQSGRHTGLESLLRRKTFKRPTLRL